MRASIAAAVCAFDPPVGGPSIITVAAPVIEVESFLAAPIPGGEMLWDEAAFAGGSGPDPRASEPARWVFAGRGEAARIEASGEDRFASLRSQAAALFASVVERRSSGCASAPSPRVFGGLSFAPRGAEDLRTTRAADAAGAPLRGQGRGPSAPWARFGDASFVLPRWLYATNGESAFLRIAAQADELRAPHALLAEADAVSDALLRGGPGLGGTFVRPRTDPTHLAQLDPAVWELLVADALTRIRAGEMEKVVAARASLLTALEPIDVVSVVARLRRDHPSCTRFVMERGGLVFLGATPELLVTLRGLDLTTEALAGSIPRRDVAGGDADDEPLSRALLDSDKDRREQALVVRGIREALEPLCAELRVPDRVMVRALRHVLHLVTPISARLRRRAHVLDLVEALHPTPAVSGLPRAPAARWIAASEPPRGWYAAPVGWFDAAGDGSFSVALRSALIDRERAFLFAGAGIVEGSSPALEYAETGAKQAAMLAAIAGSAGNGASAPSRQADLRRPSSAEADRDPSPRGLP